MWKYTLGVGAENFQYESIYEGHGRNWGENTYLEYLVGFGWVGGLMLMLFVGYPVVQLFIFFVHDRSFVLLSLFLVSLYISIACLFNVLVGNIYFYLLYSIIYSDIITRRRRNNTEVIQ